ncbi:J domain-containing protein [Dokdonella sp.]|uniref:J domain-containing protein n=1 Tax=Dokdonella sp. TaxID=2291710 RepID=UPI002F41AF07
MGDDVLDLALALQRQPSRCVLVRERALPEGIGIAIQLASAAQPILREAASRLGESESTLLEAVRFYLQQALFDPGTDAYRVLGLAPDAPPDRVRQHYRWLQRWLHPDRLGDEWESLYAKRVNWAWRQLRNAECRDAYDSRRESGADETMPPPMVARLEPGAWKAVPFANARSSWPKRIVLGLWLASVALLALAIVRFGGPPEDEPALTTIAVPAVVLPHPSRTALDDTAPSIAVRDIARSLPVVAPIPHDAPGADRPEPRVGLDVPRPRPPALDARAGNGPRPDARELPPPTAPRDRRAFAVADGVAVSSTGRRTRESASPVTAVAPIASVSDAAARADDAPGAFVADDVALARIDTADERLAEICRYFDRLDTPTPPIWNDLETQLAAERARAALHERSGAWDRTRFEVATPDWRLSNDSAALSAGYRLRSGREARESGLLTLSMVWRVRMWLVSHVELRPDP